MLPTQHAPRVGALRRRSLLVLATLALGLAACTSEAKETTAVLRFTAIPESNTTELAKKYAPLAAHLSKELGVPVEYVPSSDYGASVNMFTNGDVHLAWFGGLTGVQARQRVEGARAIAQGKVDPAYKSYFVAHKDTGLERSENFPMEIASMKFTFGSDSSTSGRLMPTWFIRQETGKSPEEFFGTPALSFSGSHDKTLELVGARAFDVGAVDYKTYDRLVKEGKVDADVVRIVWVTPPYADYNWTAHPELETLFGAGTTERLQKALVALQDPALLAAVNRPEGLIPASNADFEGLAGLARELGLAR
ncbi:MAG: putative selenate ABC transporter substrate-binding protein [Planctomycetaceae bacterium]|nr:putative selenate ABC transporter substrate-binding protein [Planctomycetaceae bacterium]